MNKKVERRALTKQLGLYELTKCSECPRKELIAEARQNNTVNPERQCGGCSVYAEIRKIGERLNLLDMPEVSLMNPPRFPGRKSRVQVEAVRDYLNKYYDELVAQEKPDKWIAKHCSISESLLRNWKKKRKADAS